MRTLVPLIIALCTVSAAAQAPRNLDIALKPHMVNNAMDYIDITMRIQNVDVKAGAPLIKMHMVAAGKNSAQYEASALRVSDARGAVQLRQTTDPRDVANNRYYRHWTANRDVKGDLTIAFHAPPNPPETQSGGPVMDMRAEDGGFNGRGGYFLVIPEDSSEYNVRVRWDLSGMPPGSRGIWTHGEGTTSRVLKPEQLVSKIFMAGPVKSYPAAVRAGGNFHIYWLTEPNWSVAEVAPTLQKLYRYYGELFDDTAHTMRIFMRRGRGNGGSGAGGSFLMNTASKDYGGPPMNTSSLTSFLAHEIFHQFAEGFKDDGGEPTYWWTEGTATFFSNLLAYRIGALTLDALASNWNGFLRNYYSDRNRNLTYKEITDNMFGAGGLNVMYGKGHAFMMLLNARIREKSNGARGLEAVVYPLVRQRRNGPITRADFLAALDRELGPQGRAEYEAFRAGGKLLDLPPDLMGPCFRRVPVSYRAYELGFDANAATTGPRVIRNLVANSAAARAGLREGDAVLTPIDQQGLRRDTAATLTIQVKRGEQPFRVTYQPRALTALDGFTWVRDASVSESECRLGKLP